MSQTQAATLVVAAVMCVALLARACTFLYDIRYHVVTLVNIANGRRP